MGDWSVATWTALGTWALVIGTLALMYWQTRQSHELNSANAILVLRERFDLPRMRQARRELAGRLLDGRHEDITSVEVATHFELLGALAHRKVLRLDLVWEAYGTWVTSYYHALRQPVDLIARARAELRDPLVFHEFEWLHDRILAIDRRQLGAVHAAALERDEEARSVLARERLLDVT